MEEQEAGWQAVPMVQRGPGVVAEERERKVQSRALGEEKHGLGELQGEMTGLLLCVKEKSQANPFQPC